MNREGSFKIECRLPTVLEFQRLRNSTNWDKLEDSAVEIGISNTIFSVCVLLNESIIGMARIVGDGALYYYIQDVIVLPKFRRIGIGKTMMNEIEKYLAENAPRNAFIGLMSAEGVKEFYLQFGYKPRNSQAPGMFKIKS